MIKLIIFDLDGVLVDAKEIHYQSLNMALKEIGGQFVISRDEHLAIYDGLPTKKKLEKLHQNKGLRKSVFSFVWKAKQKATLRIINEMKPDVELRGLLKELKSSGYMIAVATNSIRETTKMMLVRRGLIDYIDFFYSNQDVINPKPNPEMYLRCMIKAEVSPKETLIVEDSHIGRKSALSSGAWLCPVKDRNDVTYHKIVCYIDAADEGSEIKPKWQGGAMNVLIPMAGAGTRFAEKGYTFPKPLIEVEGKPMIQVVVENLNIDARHIFVVHKDHFDKYNLKQMLEVISPGCEIIISPGKMLGAAWDTLLATDFINNDEPLLLANSDQYIEWDSNNFMYSMTSDDIDGGILTFEATHPKWSYARLAEDGFVVEVAEKKPISKHATVGIYYWAKGSDYVRYAEQMIERDIRTNNEYYVCPVYNEAIADGKRIKIFPVDRMWGLGTPEDLETYLRK